MCIPKSEQFHLDEHCKPRAVIRYEQQFGAGGTWYTYVTIRHPYSGLWYDSSGTKRYCREMATLLESEHVRNVEVMEPMSE